MEINQDSPKFTPYIVKEGDRFDTISQAAYGDSTYIHTLIMDNPHVQNQIQLPAGEQIFVRIKRDPTTGAQLPPWFLDEAEDPTVTDPGTVIPPVIEGPAVPLGFSQGYPVVVGNKIRFAINRTGRYPFSVEKKTGGVVFQSSGYDFSSGFPIETADIVDGGLYLVKVGPITSGDLTVIGSGVALAFVTEPYFDSVNTNLFIRFKINKAGNFRTKVIRTSDEAVISDTTLAYTLDELKGLSIAVAGTYRVEVDTLEKVVTVAFNEIEDAPPWLIALGWSYAYLSRDCSIHTQSFEPVEVAMVRADSGVMNGLNADLAPWTSGIFQPAQTLYAVPPYNGVTRFNPLVPGSGGVEKLVDHYVWVRRISDRTQVFVQPFTPPELDYYSPQAFDFTPGLEACAGRARINSEITATRDYLRFLFGGTGVYAFKWRTYEMPANTLFDNGVTWMTDGIGGSPIWDPTNVPRVDYNIEHEPGLYRLEIEGHTCDSEPTTLEFVVADDGSGGEEPEPPVITGPVTPKIVNFSPIGDINISIAGSDGDWTISDISTATLNPGFTFLYKFGGEKIRQGFNLTNKKWECNDTLMIEKFKVRLDMEHLGQLGDRESDFLQNASLGATCAFTEIGFNEF